MDNLSNLYSQNPVCVKKHIRGRDSNQITRQQFGQLNRQLFVIHILFTAEVQNHTGHAAGVKPQHHGPIGVAKLPVGLPGYDKLLNAGGHGGDEK